MTATSRDVISQDPHPGRVAWQFIFDTHLRRNEPQGGTITEGCVVLRASWSASDNRCTVYVNLQLRSLEVITSNT